VLNLFEELNADGLTLAVVTHDPEVAEMAHRRVAFRDGHIVSDERGPQA
jgi:putative ABC transport system ATP-binding protein